MGKFCFSEPICIFMDYLNAVKHLCNVILFLSDKITLFSAEKKLRQTESPYLPLLRKKRIRSQMEGSSEIKGTHITGMEAIMGEVGEE
jgi:hypothetical protein